MNAPGLSEFFQIPAITSEKTLNAPTAATGFPERLARTDGQFSAHPHDQNAAGAVRGAEPVLYRLRKPQLTRLVWARNEHGIAVWNGLPSLTLKNL